jgi:hypothetical protein
LEERVGIFFAFAYDDVVVGSNKFGQAVGNAANIVKTPHPFSLTVFSPGSEIFRVVSNDLEEQFTALVAVVVRLSDLSPSLGFRLPGRSVLPPSTVGHAAWKSGITLSTNRQSTWSRDKRTPPDEKTSLKVTGLDVSPACIAGVRTVVPNFNDLCGRTKL